MVKITAELVRRKAEHNEKEIGTLEELSLHQENIEKIENLQHWCRHLQILLLQSNLISRIENVGKLKKLRYLNLALNNIECVENMEGLESLEKLDLTLNFIGDIQSVAHLKNNYHLRCLILTGNPCVDFRHYREYIITEVPQITELDCKEISRSERIWAKQGYDEKRVKVAEDQAAYIAQRNIEKMEEQTDNTAYHDEPDAVFWNKKSKNTPEERVRIARQALKIRENGNEDSKKRVSKKELRLFNKDGKPLNINQPKVPFKLFEDGQNGSIVLDVAIYRYLDTNQVEVDVQPTFVTISIKQQVLQVVLEEEILVSKTTCRRSQTTGHLEVRMPKQQTIPTIAAKVKDFPPSKEKLKYLDVRAPGDSLDFGAIVEKKGVWKDDPEVPPLE